jgi:tripartite-type tricarboxylate transporter receptor subunit TctC
LRRRVFSCFYGTLDFLFLSDLTMLNPMQFAPTFLVATLLALPFAAQAQSNYPNKPIKLIIGFAAGGPLDQHARLWADRLQAVLGQPVIVDYKAGAGGNIGAEFVKLAPADGYTLMLANTGVMVINPALYTKIPYQTLKDFTPIARTAMQPLAIVTHPSLPVKDYKEFINYAKANPGKLNYGSAGNGGISHLVPEMLKTNSGIFTVHIPYRGSAPAFTDLMAGQVQWMAESVPQAAQYHKQGKVRAIAVTSAARNPALPDIPTLIEQGVKGFEVVGFYGVLAPANLPKDITAKLSGAFKTVLETPDLRNRMISQGADPAFLGSDEFTAFLGKQMPIWAKAVKQSGAKLD